MFGHSFSTQLNKRSVILRGKKIKWVFVTRVSQEYPARVLWDSSVEKLHKISPFIWFLVPHRAKRMTAGYQQPVTSALQLKELRCKEPSLSALSEGHQRLRWSESAAALTVSVSPLSLQKNLFVLRMFTDPGEDKQPVPCLSVPQVKHGAVGPFWVCESETSGYVLLFGHCLSCPCLCNSASHHRPTYKRKDKEKQALFDSILSSDVLSHV